MADSEDRDLLLEDVALVAVAIQQTTMTLKSKDDIHAAFIRILELVPADVRGVPDGNSNVATSRTGVRSR